MNMCCFSTPEKKKKSFFLGKRYDHFAALLKAYVVLVFIFSPRQLSWKTTRKTSYLQAPTNREVRCINRIKVSPKPHQRLDRKGTRNPKEGPVSPHARAYAVGTLSFSACLLFVCGWCGRGLLAALDTHRQPWRCSPPPPQKLCLPFTSRPRCAPHGRVPLTTLRGNEPRLSCSQAAGVNRPRHTV